MQRFLALVFAPDIQVPTLSNGWWLVYVAAYLPLIDIILFAIIIAIVIVRQAYTVKVQLGKKKAPESKGVSLDMTEYLRYKSFRSLVEKYPKISETDFAEYASALFAGYQKAKETEKYDALREYCDAEFYKRLPGMDDNKKELLIVQEAKPYAWESNAETATVIIKIVASDLRKSGSHPREYDLFLTRSILADKQKKLPQNCPYCGAVTDFEMNGGTCPSCGRVLRRELAEWLWSDLTEVLKKKDVRVL